MSKFKRNGGWIIVLASLLSVGGYIAWSYSQGTVGFPLDDAWIHQTYARNLAQTGQLAYLPGQPSAGSTSPAWSFLLSVGYLLGRKRAEEEREQVIAQLQEALAQIKTLSGLIPICALCKKVRDDRGYWRRIEEYIRSHSDATFSHGYCPECAAKLQAELAEQRDDPSDDA